FGELLDEIEQATADVDGNSGGHHVRDQCVIRVDKVEALKKDYSFPKYFPSEVFARTELWIGPAGSRTTLHFDNCDNLFVLLSGRKRFQLYPPRAMRRFAPFDSAPLFAFSRRDGGKIGIPIDRVLAEDPIK